MRKEQIVGIAVRLFALFLFIYTLRHASGLVVLLLESQPYKVSLAFYLAIVLFPILAAILLWFFPLTVAGKLIPDTKPEELPIALSGTEIETVAFSILGLWILATAIPDIFHWATFGYLVKASGVGRAQLTPENIGNIVGTVVELVIGFWLLFGSKGIAGLIRRYRYAGS